MDSKGPLKMTLLWAFGAEAYDKFKSFSVEVEMHFNSRYERPELWVHVCESLASVESVQDTGRHWETACRLSPFHICHIGIITTNHLVSCTHPTPPRLAYCSPHIRGWEAPSPDICGGRMMSTEYLFTVVPYINNLHLSWVSCGW